MFQQKKPASPAFDALVLGAALFSMFFGAGNMIFPPFLGFSTGGNWFTGFGCYFLADIGLAMLGVAALIRKRGAQEVVRPLGKVAGKALLAAVAMCMSLAIGIPRTAATTFELSVAPLTDAIPLPVFCAVFFALVLALSISRSAVVDVVGKVLTPLLFFGLLFAIARGVLAPVGEIAPSSELSAAVSLGVFSGYQTMDVFAALFLGMLILEGAADRGYSSSGSLARISFAASGVASAGLLVVYMGLTYLGATASTAFPAEITRTELLNTLIARLLPGRVGGVFFGVVVALACLTTAIALTSSAAEFFSQLLNGRFGYRTLVVVICLTSAVLACVGVDRLIAFAADILSVIYPPMLTLIVLTFFDRQLCDGAVRLACAAAFLVSLGDVLGFLRSPIALLPFAAQGFAWSVPTLVAVALGAAFFRKKTVTE